MRTPQLADEVLNRVTAVLEPAHDPQRAVAMAAYMKDHFAFLGIPSPERRALVRDALTGLPRPTEPDVIDVALRCWSVDEREYQFVAVDYCVAHLRVCSSTFLTTAEHLVTTKSWWDTVDPLASRIVGGLVAADPALRADMDRWLGSDDMWLARSAILHQLRYKEATDADWLFAACLRHAADSRFFLRKAIGWALREYSRTDATAVRSFVADHEDELSGLSRREALKWLDRRAGRAGAHP